MPGRPEELRSRTPRLRGRPPSSPRSAKADTLWGRLTEGARHPSGPIGSPTAPDIADEVHPSPRPENTGVSQSAPQPVQSKRVGAGLPWAGAGGVAHPSRASASPEGVDAAGPLQTRSSASGCLLVRRGPGATDRQHAPSSPRAREAPGPRARGCVGRGCSTAGRWFSGSGNGARPEPWPAFDVCPRPAFLATSSFIRPQLPSPSRGSPTPESVPEFRVSVCSLDT